jgi:hypothetical protein
MTPETPRIEKRPYAEPQLRVYGDIREITQNTFNTGMGDSFNSSMTA